MHPRSLLVPVTRCIALGLALAGGCFADPGPAGSGNDDAGSTGAATTATSEGSTSDEPTSAAPTTGGPDDCGDAQLDPGEECDIGPDSGQNGSACKADCTLNKCGDGYLAASEGCDDGNAVDDDACSNACKLTGCGNGKLGPGEQCDDGNAVDSDACSNLCKLPFCGDGVLGGAEECDNGPQNADDRACKLDCTKAVCGDGHLQTNVESCDDGNLDDTDGCTSQCILTSCGDGVVQSGEDCDDGNTRDSDGCSNTCQAPCGNGIVDPGEACDDGNVLDGDTCSPACERAAFLVFVTSKKFEGALGGIAGANDICNTLAESAGLPGAGKYRAWLSNDTDAPFASFLHSNLPYRRTDGKLVADNWSDMTTSSLLSPISRTETGQTLAGGGPDCADNDTLVWTNTTQMGLAKLDAHCDGWTIGAHALDGGAGDALQIGPGWTDSCVLSCGTSARLYCFEQP
jgi:cysteine-rich repeat protein